jgi:hypothetical protein
MHLGIGEAKEVEVDDQIYLPSFFNREASVKVGGSSGGKMLARYFSILVHTIISHICRATDG